MLKVIVIVSKEIKKEILDYYSNNFLDDDIIVVSPGDIPFNISNYNNVIFKKDKDFLNRRDYPFIEKTNRPNWYYQQFLKYKIVLDSGYELIHIVDGDSYVRSNIIFSNKLFYSNKNIEVNYARFIALLSKNETITDKNFITNQMCFNKYYLLEFIQSLGMNVDNWIFEICKILEKNENLWFSEYQCYANFVLNNKKNKEKKIRVFRRFDLINNSIYQGFKNYSVLACEDHHTTDLIRKIRAHILYLLKLNLG